jgi:hypothetical protein
MAQEQAKQYGQRDDGKAEGENVSQVSGKFQQLGDDNDAHDCDLLAPGQPRRFNPAMRSTPIAIVRDKGGHQDRHPDTSDEEESVDVESEAVKIASGNTSRSLPGRVLRAPFLGSVPSNEDYISYQNMLPPPMALSEQPAPGEKVNADQGTSYGSLRDSNARGRFLDGPSSYRDKGTGDIRSIQHRVRFRDNTTISSSAPSHSISIGERIMRSRKLQAINGVDKASEERTSSLSAMLEATDDSGIIVPDVPKQSLGVSAMKPSANQQSTAFYDDESEDGLSSNMLSTSLTGLEVLQRAARFRSVQEAASDSDSEAPTAIPRDSNNYNALMSRSLSDPVPRFGQLNLGGVTNPATSGIASFLSHPGYPPLPIPSHQVDTAASINSAIYQPGFVQTGVELAEPLDENPDIEGAFDMDME